MNPDPIRSSRKNSLVEIFNCPTRCCGSESAWFHIILGSQIRIRPGAGPAAKSKAGSESGSASISKFRSCEGDAKWRHRGSPWSGGQKASGWLQIASILMRCRWIQTRIKVKSRARIRNTGMVQILISFKVAHWLHALSTGTQTRLFISFSYCYAKYGTG